MIGHFRKLHHALFAPWKDLLLICSSRPLSDDGQQPTAAEYNKELEHHGGLSWLNAPWLYTECYLCMFFTGPGVA